MTGPFPEAIAHYPPTAQVFIKRLYNRVTLHNKNCMCGLFGPTGGGKSFTALSIMVGIYLYTYGTVDPKEIIRHVSFRASEFIHNVSDKSTRRRGDVWIWDEAGVDAGTQDHATRKNKFLGQYAQTSRHQNQIVLFTLPSLGMLTPQVRKLLHFYIEAVSIDERKKWNKVKILEMQYNVRQDKIYYHRIRTNTRGRGMQIINFAYFPLVDKPILDIYEEKKVAFTNDLNVRIEQEMRNFESTEKIKNGINMWEKHEQVYVLYHTFSKKAIEICKRIGINVKNVYMRMQSMDKRYPGWRNDPTLLGNMASLIGKY
jgi:energy-coupling factor transporter ATP-binding protein EcfA2